MVRTNASTNEKHRFYNLTVQDIARGGGDFFTKVEALCAGFVDMGDPVKTQVENWISKIFDFWGHIIDVYDQDILILNDQGIHYEERKKNNVSDHPTVGQRRSIRFIFCDDGPTRPI